MPYTYPNSYCARKVAPKSLCSGLHTTKSLNVVPATPANRYGAFVSDASEPVYYNSAASTRATPPKSSYTHDPYTPLGYELSMTVVNLPFERADFVEPDLAVLFDHISDSIVPLHAAGRMDTCPAARYYAKFAGCATGDATIDAKGFPAKTRYVVIKTNYAPLNELLHDHRLYILADRLSFHVCWDGKQVVSGEGDEAQGYVHDVKKMREQCDEIRSMGLRARHRTTDGLPCTAVRFDCFFVGQ